MIGYRCTSCGAEYSPNEYRDLDRQPLDDTDDDPSEGAGYEKVCGECGSGFHSEKWQLQETIETDDGEFYISTVALPIGHGLEHNLWFETLIESPWSSEVADRYHTREEAEAGHEALVKQIEAGAYGMEPVAYRLVLDRDRDGDQR